MAWVKKIIEAIKLKMMLNRLSKAKENAMRDFLGLPPKMSWYDECTTTVSTCVRDKMCQVFCPCCVYDRQRHKKVPSCWNSPVLKEFFGFLAGLALTSLLYLLLIYQMDVPPERAGPGCMIVGLVLTMLLAFSQACRCLVLLILPQFFSAKGRMLLLMYALFLAMNHPLRNVNRNINIMSQSSICGQEIAANETRELVKSATAPMKGIIDSVSKVMTKLQDFANKLKSTYTVLKKTVSSIGNTIAMVAQWLKSMTDTCNEKMGQPYQQCKDAFQRGYDSCRRKMWIFADVCKIVRVVDWVCNLARVGELLCVLIDAIKKLLMKSVSLPTIGVLKSAEEMFYFNVTIDYKFNYTIDQSRSYKDIKQDIHREIQAHVTSFLKAIGIFKNVLLLSIIFVVVQALIYRSRYISNDHFDNFYITFTVRDLDERRKENHKGSILPLTFDEENKYIASLSGRMLKRELRKLGIGLVMLMVSMFNAAFYLFCDYGLYSALSLIEKHFGIISKPPVPPHTKLHVAGQGPMADMYRSIVAMFDPISKTNVEMNIARCVSHPSEPDWTTYRIIAFIYFVCFVLTFGEAYGMRMRHKVMACYYPRRERKRAIWLFNHILKTRGGIIERARMSIKARKLGNADPEHISLKGRLAANFPLCEKLLKLLGWEVKSCLYCGREGKPDDYLNFIHCDFYDCDAVYCIECYADLKNVCAVCENAVAVTGGSDDDEVDSSIDLRQKRKTKKQKRQRDKRIAELEARRRPSQVMMRFRNQFGMPGKDFSVDVPQKGTGAAVGQGNGIGKNGPVDKRNAKQRIQQVQQARMKKPVNKNKSAGFSSDDIDDTNASDDVTGTRDHLPYNSSVGVSDDEDELGIVNGVGANNNSYEFCEYYSDVDDSDNGTEEMDEENVIGFLTAQYSDSPKRTFLRHRVGYSNTNSNAREYMTSSSDDDVTSGSSVDTDDLDYSYQNRKTFSDVECVTSDNTESDLSGNETYRPKLDLVTEDIFSDTENTDDSDSEWSVDIEGAVKDTVITDEPASFTMARE